MKKPIQLDAYRNAEKIGETEKYLVKECALKYYINLHHIILRQIGKEEYKGEFGEKKFFELLNLKEQNQLEDIAKRLETIIEAISKKLK